jgi:hypothetical protein
MEIERACKWRSVKALNWQTHKLIIISDENSKCGPSFVLKRRRGPPRCDKNATVRTHGVLDR